MWNVPSPTGADEAATGESEAPFAITTLPGLPAKRMSNAAVAAAAPVSRVDLRIWIVAGAPEQLQRYEKSLAPPEKSAGRFSIPCDGIAGDDRDRAHRASAGALHDLRIGRAQRGCRPAEREEERDDGHDERRRDADTHWTTHW